MRVQMMKRARFLILYAALSCGMVFSAMTLASNTAYAACDCQRIAQDVGSYCSEYGGVQYFHCDPTFLQFKCAFSSWHGGPCP
jgi:hypothetical protein